MTSRRSDRIIRGPLLVSNRLLTALPAEDYERIRPTLEPVALAARQVLHRRGEALRHVYFPNGCLCSVMTSMADGSEVEVAAIGRDGMTGIGALHGATVHSSDTVVRAGTSTALEMTVETLRGELRREEAFADILHRYALAFTACIMQRVACHARHTVRQRCCGWLLMTSEQLDGEFAVSQETMATILGARRPTITSIAGRLQREGVIRYGRGRVGIVDRRGLEREACDCHRAIRGEFERLGL